MTSFKPMLAKDADLTKLAWPQIAQRKLDGIRASVVDGRLVSRTLKPIPNAEIRAALERPEFEGFDGEIIVGDTSDEACYRRTASFVMAPDKTGEPWAFHVFDLWNSTESYVTRYVRLSLLLNRHVPNGGPIKRVENTRVDSLADLDALEEAWLADGAEGVILRDPAGKYKFGRSGKAGPLLKVKRFIDFEAEVIGVYEEMHNANEAKRNALGRTERSTAASGLVGKGTLGGLVLRALNGPHEGQEFRCGTGFDAAMRRDLWDEWKVNRFYRRVAKVKAFPIGVKDKPRHPVFLGWRDMAVDG